MKYKLTKEQLENRLKVYKYNIAAVARAEQKAYGTIRQWIDDHEIVLPIKKKKEK